MNSRICLSSMLALTLLQGLAFSAPRKLPLLTRCEAQITGFLSPFETGAKAEARKRSKSATPLSHGISAYRKAHLERASVRKLKVNEISYKVLGKLGEGSGTAFLCQHPNGAKVVVKRISTPETPAWAYSVFYEVAVTKFYAENGVRVPKIYDFQLAKKSSEGELAEAWLVKEYREGITEDEMLYAASEGNAAFPYETMHRLQEELKAEKERIAVVHRRFKAWLKAKELSLSRLPLDTLKRLVESGDFGMFSDNMLYDIELHQWILFDP